MKKRNKKKARNSTRSPLGARPGHFNTQSSLNEDIEVKAHVYDSQNCQLESFSSVEALQKSLTQKKIHWIHFNSKLTPEIALLLSKLDFHSLSIEDIYNDIQRPKYENFQTFDFIVSKFVYENEESETRQLNILIHKNLIISIAEDSALISNILTKRINSSSSRIKRLPIGYLAYCLVDIAVDTFFPVLDQVTINLDDLEEEIMHNNSDTVIQKIYAQKQHLIHLRKTTTSHRDLLAQVMKDKSTNFPENLSIYIRDAYDHTCQQLEFIDSSNENASNLMDISLSLSSHKSNEIMKFLTLVTSIFIPLSFIAGIYGMNFDTKISPFNMPELNLRFGYLLVLGLMLSTVLLMICFFKKKKWL